MLIRVLSEADAADYWQLRLRALREHPDAFGASYEEQQSIPLDTIVERFRTQWSAPNNCILGAFDAHDHLVGVVGLRQENAAKVRHKGWIWGMYVASEVRAKGVGKALLVEAIARARELSNLVQLHLSVVTRNDRARSLYRSLGFEVYGLEPRALRVNGEYLDEEFMILRLG